jgi:CheY-like chemotaxis protein
MAKILVADDDNIVRDRLSEELGKPGHTVVTVSDGIGALHEAKTGSYDVLVLDCLMQQSGIEVLEKLRKDPEYAHVKDLPVIGITDLSKKKKSDLRHFVDDGASRAWDKRLDCEGIRELLALIEDVLK